MLLGKGSEDIEALPSYLLRLAICHGVSTSLLIKAIADRQKGGFGKQVQNIRSAPLSALVRPNSSTDAVVQALGEAGYESEMALQSATLLCLQHALNRPTLCFSAKVRWCPACFSEQIKTGLPPYLKVVWFLEAMNVCNHHHLALRSRCPVCGSHQSTWAMPRSIGHCLHCGNSLAGPTSDDVLIRDPIDAAYDLVSLVQFQAAHPGVSFPRGGLSNVIRAFFNRASMTQREARLWRRIPREECVRFADPKESITLVTARRVAYRLDVPLVDLLLGQAEGVNRSFLFSSEQPLPESLAPRTRNNCVDKRALTINLKTALQTRNREPMSLRQVARSLNVSVGALRYHCPKEAARLVTKWNQAQRLARRQRSIRAKRAVRETVATWARHPQTPLSRKGLLRVLMAKTGLPKNLLRREIGLRV